MADLRINILADTRDAVRELKRVQEETKRVQESTLKWVKLGTQIKAIGAAWRVVTGVVGAAARRIRETTELAKTQFDAERKLAAVLTATGGAAGYSAAELRKYASELQSVTNFGDEATIDAMAVLATFTQVRGPIFKQTVAAAQDMSAVLGTDLKAAMLQVGKAMNDPIAGLTALRRSGVSFTQQQREQIRTLVQSGDILGAQRVILAEVNKEFGGAAKAMADPATQMKNAWGDLKEKVGDVFMMLGATLAKTLLPVVERFTQWLAETPAASSGFVAAIRMIIDAISLLYRSFMAVMGLMYEGTGFLIRILSKMPQFVIGESGQETLRNMADEYGKYAASSFSAAATPTNWGQSFESGFEEVRSQFAAMREEGKNVPQVMAEAFTENKGKILDVINGLRDELENIGVDETTRKLRELKELGADEEQLREAESILKQIEALNAAKEAQRKEQEEFAQAQREAQQILKEMRSPEQKLADDMNRVKELMEMGLLSRDQYMQYIEKQRAELIQPQDDVGKQYAAAITAGGGAFSAIISAMSAYQAAGRKPEQETAENTARMVELLDSLLAQARKDAEQGVEI